MRVLSGTSGFGYAAWKGRFYPPTLPAAQMLSSYASRLEAVEINATFRRLPRAEMLAGWSRQVPPGFVFSLKAPQQITHVRKLRGAGSAVDALHRAALELGPHLGPTLYQLPPTFAADVPLLHDFLEALPGGARVAFEFRHDSWFGDRTFETLAGAGAALCVADSDERSTPFVPTAPFGYLRLRRATYSDRELQGWLDRARTSGWTEVLVFFKHEEEARGPELALRLRSLAGPLVGQAPEPPAPEGPGRW